MGFWQRVDDELNFIGMSRKELATKAQFPDSYIPKGIARNSIPSADLAVRIAHVLKVPLEYLLDMQEEAIVENSNERMRLFGKYRQLIEQLENLNPKKQSIVRQLCMALADRLD